MDAKVKINCHSSICIDDDIYIDPFNIVERKKNARIVFVTHSHYDHLDIKSIDNVSNGNTVIVGPEDVIAQLQSKYAKCKVAKIDESADIMGVFYNSFPSYNLNKKFHPRSNNWVGFYIKVNDISYVVCGDSDATPELLSQKCDVLLIPVGGTYTMNYKEAAEAANIIKPKLAIPTHYGSVVGNKDDGIKFKNELNKNINCEILI